MLTRGAQFDRYVIAEELGEGAMGRVYKAYDRRLQRHVALKVVNTGEGSASHHAARLLKEARAAAAFDHPHAVQVFDVGIVDGELYIAMELVVGRTLRAFIGRPEIGAAQKTDWLLQAARALAAAHRAGLVHRDIKPDNIMVRDDGVVKVLDFGIAHMMHDDDVIEDAPTVEGINQDPYAMAAFVGKLTAEGMILGTPAYMAPEQILGASIDGRADQHAWGITAYELFFGDLPWPDGTMADLVRAVVEQPVDTASHPELPSSLAKVILRAIRKRPDERFPSMEALLAALHQPEGSRRPAWKLWVPAAATVATLTLGVGLYLGRSQAQPAPPAPTSSPTASVAATSTASPAATASAADRAQQAQRLAYRGELEAARKAYDHCIADDPRATACLEGRIWLNQDAGRCAEMARDAQRILEHEPHHSDAYRYLAEARFATNASQDDVEALLAEGHRHAEDGERDRLEALDEARLAILNGEFKQALAGLKRARGDGSRGDVALSALRLELSLLLELGRTPAAGSLAERYLEASRTVSRGGIDDRAMMGDPTVLLMRASLAGGRRTRDGFEAKRDAWLASWNAKVAPHVRRHVWAHFYAATTRDGEDAQDALDVFDRYAPRVRYHPGVPADAWMGRVDAWAGHYDRAVRHLDRAVAACEAIAFPLEHVQAAFALGRIHEAADRRQQACRAYQRVMSRWGRSRGSLTARGVRKHMADAACSPPAPVER